MPEFDIDEYIKKKRKYEKSFGIVRDPKTGEIVAYPEIPIEGDESFHKEETIEKSDLKDDSGESVITDSDITVEKLIQDYEHIISKIVLYCITELPFPLGIKKTISLLKGSKSTFIIEHQLHNLRTYSILSTFTRDQLRVIIESLIKAELLKIEFVSKYKNMPVLKITTRGKDFMRDKLEIEIKFLEDFVERGVPEFNKSEEKLFNELRKLRRDIAHQEDIPAFMVCGDTALRELVKQKPTDISSLLSVHGIGKKFTENYGDKFIEAIIAHISNEETALE